jgi:hypothetical protein
LRIIDLGDVLAQMRNEGIHFGLHLSGMVDRTGLRMSHRTVLSTNVVTISKLSAC